MDFFSFVKPKNDLETTSGKQDNVPFIPEDMWMKCPKCNHHFRLSANRSVELFSDP